jgi:energy-coupling factor transport system permease protein
MSQRFDFYLPRDSWLHRLDPRTKLWAVLLFSVAALLFHSLAVLAGLLLLAHLALWAAKIPAERVRWLWLRLLPMLAMILVLQPLFAPGPGPDLVSLGPLRLTAAGLLSGLSFALRAATLAFLAAALLLTTELNRLVQGLVKLGLPYPGGLTAALALRYLPTTYGLFVSIGEAQQARGWIVGQGGFVRRARSYVPILVATIIAALRLSDSLALALAARGLGYPARRTTLYEVRFGPADWAAVAVTTVAFAALLAVRYGLGFGATPW